MTEDISELIEETRGYVRCSSILVFHDACARLNIAAEGGHTPKYAAGKADLSEFWKAFFGNMAVLRHAQYH